MIYPTSRIPDALRKHASEDQRETSGGSPQPQTQVPQESTDVQEDPANDVIPPCPNPLSEDPPPSEGDEDVDEVLPGPRIERQSNNVIGVVVPRLSPLVNQFDNAYLVNTHPSVFPWGAGKQPEGMSQIAYYRLLAERVPVAQFGHNVGLIFDMFDLWQRAEVRYAIGYNNIDMIMNTSLYMGVQSQN